MPPATSRDRWRSFDVRRQEKNTRDTKTSWAPGATLALLETGDRVRVDLNVGTVNMLISDEELAERRENWQPPELYSQTPWQEIYRSTVGQLADGACMELAVKYRNVRENTPRHSH